MVPRPSPRLAENLQELSALPDAHDAAAPPDLGLVMGGGGARAAYQVGVLRCIARCFPDLTVPYLHGVSAGAINAVHLAAHHGTFLQAVEELTHLWGRLTVNDVFRVDSWSLVSNLARWVTQLLTGGRAQNPSRGLVDTTPLHELLTEVFHAVDGEITGIHHNLTKERLRALALTTASYTTGQSVTWVQGNDIEEWKRPQRTSVKTVMTVDHVMASTALPLLFPAVELPGGWYGDGGMRLIAPLSPVLHLGARRVLAISTRYDRPQSEADRAIIRGYPPPAQVVGVMMNAIFLDLLDADVMRLERLNDLVEALPPEKRRGLREIDMLILRPSRDLGKLAGEHEAELPGLFRFLTRGWGTRQTESPDFLSLVLFEPGYLQALMEMGEQDALARRDEIEAFLSAETPAPAGSSRV